MNSTPASAPLIARENPIAIPLGQTPEEAARRLAASARQGFPDAQLVLAQLYLDGHGVPRDPRTALHWFEQAAAGGRAEAINMVGRCHELGWGTPADPATAARWYRRAARRGHDWARFNLAGLLLDGEGVGQDAREALSLYVMAARRGHAKSMTMVGRFCEEGWGRRPRPAAAERWYRRGADGGDFRGHFNLGRLLLRRGQADVAVARLARAIEAATPIFCRDVAADLLGHATEAVQMLGRRCLARACETRDPADIDRYNALLSHGRIGFTNAPTPRHPAVGALSDTPPVPPRSLLRRWAGLWRGRAS